MEIQRIIYMLRSEKSKLIRIGLFILVAICVETFVIVFIQVGYDPVFPEPAERQAELEREFKAIAPLEGAKLVRYWTSRKLAPLQALVSASYLTDATSTDIFKHYDEQLKQQGWQFYEIKKIRLWDKDLGGQSALYCKGDYFVDIYYAGGQAPNELTYAIGMSWGIYNYCEQARGVQADTTPVSP